MDYKWCFWSSAGNLQMQRTDCRYCSTPFCVRNLSICGFWYLQGSWNKSTSQTKRKLKVGGVTSYMQYFDCTGVVTLNPCVVHGSTVFTIQALFWELYMYEFILSFKNYFIINYNSHYWQYEEISLLSDFTDAIALISRKW